MAKAILILDRPVEREQDLKQPYAASTTYVQRGDAPWQMLPVDAPLVEHYIILKPEPGGSGRTGVQVQNPDGSGFGGTCGPVTSQP